MASPRAWRTTLVSLLPFWLLSIAVMAEGFPRPPVPIRLAYASFVLAILTVMLLL